MDLKHNLLEGKMRKVICLSIMSLFMATLSGCFSAIAKHDTVAYEKATSLKVDALAVMEKAKGNGKYEDSQAKVEELQGNLQKTYEFVRGTPNNTLVTEMWGKMVDPKAQLLAGFLDDWKSKGSLGDYFVKEKIEQIGKAFDQIIELEAAKNK
jgi:hypothetical protein